MSDLGRRGRKVSIFCSSADILRRLDNVESHFKSCDDRAAATLVVEAELTSQLKDVARFFSDYTNREAAIMKEHATREEQNASKNTSMLRNIQEDITAIKTDLASQPKDVALLLLKQQEEIKDYVIKEFATKVELTEGFTSLRKQAKAMWWVGITCLAGFIAAFDKMVPLIDLTKLLK